MARSLYQTLIRTSQPALFATKPPPTATYANRFLTLRTQSSQSENSQNDSETEQREAMAVQKIEDAIHLIIIRRSAPDWLPFLPGSSYWVPPRRQSYGIADLVDKLANALTDDEVMSLTVPRGWPSSAFYSTDASPDPAGVEATSKEMLKSEDENE